MSLSALPNVRLTFCSTRTLIKVIINPEDQRRDSVSKKVLTHTRDHAECHRSLRDLVAELYLYLYFFLEPHGLVNFSKMSSRTNLEGKAKIPKM